MGESCAQNRNLLRLPAICEVLSERQAQQALSVDRCLSHLAPLGRTVRQHYVGEFLKQKRTISAKWTRKYEVFC